jgi:S-adenosylmethionine-diacylglycerol 3-amino-3-carboxypropyl transferase
MHSSEIAAKADFGHIRYAQLWEDADVLTEALGDVSGGTLVSICSAGDNALAMLTLDPAKVVVVDLSPAQIACLRLRIGAFRTLTHREFLELMGARPSARRRQLLERVTEALDPGTRAFWATLADDVAAHGAGGVGKFETYFRIFRRRLLPLVHSRRTIDDIFVSRELPEREEFFERRFNTCRWRLLLNIFFSRFVMGRMGRDRAFFDHVDGSPAQHVARRIRHAGIACDPAENPYLHWIMKGTHGDALPMPWREDHFETIRARLDRLDIRPGSLEAFVSTGERADGFNLSDIFEYMSPEMFATVYASILDAANPGCAAGLLEHDGAAPGPTAPAAPGAHPDRARGPAESARTRLSSIPISSSRRSSGEPGDPDHARAGIGGRALGLMAGVPAHARRLEIGAEVQRKLIHVGTGLYALSLPWLFPDRWPVYVLIGVTLVVMLVLRLPNSRLGKTLHGVERQSYGDLLLALSVGSACFSRATTCISTSCPSPS